MWFMLLMMNLLPLHKARPPLAAAPENNFTALPKGVRGIDAENI
jgi:hypothetical protein